jgi:hypothetical protein
MFETLLPSQTLSATPRPCEIDDYTDARRNDRHIAAAAPTVGDEFDAAIKARYPHLSPLVQSQLSAFDRKVARDGIDSVHNAPIFPERLRNRGPLAY